MPALANLLDEERIVFSDADAFWLSPMKLRYDGPKICCGKNTGFFYYNKSGPRHNLFSLWQLHTLLMMLGRPSTLSEFQRLTLYTEPEPNEEITFQYLITAYPEYIELCREHCIYGYSPEQYGFDPISKETNFVHFAGGYTFRKKRILPLIVFKEYYTTLMTFDFEQNDYVALAAVTHNAQSTTGSRRRSPVYT